MEFFERTKYDETMARPLKKAGRFEMRLSADDEYLLEKLIEKLGGNRATIYEQALRMLARRERISLPGKVQEESE